MNQWRNLYLNVWFWLYLLYRPYIYVFSLEAYHVYMLLTVTRGDTQQLAFLGTEVTVDPSQVVDAFPVAVNTEPNVVVLSFELPPSD